jgi:HEAT repeat protein
MRDLEFEPAVPLLTVLLRRPDGLAQGFSCLRQFATRAVPVVLASMKSSEPEERRLACLAASQMKDSRLGPASVTLLGDENARTRATACYAIGNNWDDALAPRLVEKLSDPSEEVQTAACSILKQHPNESMLPIYRKLLEDDTVAAGKAVQLAGVESYSRTELMHLFSSTNLSVVSTVFNRFPFTLTVDEVEPLLINSLPMARLMGLGELTRMSSKPTIDRMVSMLRDPNEIVQWRDRSALRLLTGQKLGADPAAYEQWWKENRETFTPRPPGELRPQRQSRFEPVQ